MLSKETGIYRPHARKKKCPKIATYRGLLAKPHAKY